MLGGQVRAASLVRNVGMGCAYVILKSVRWTSSLSVLQQALRILRQNSKIRHFWKIRICREQRTECAVCTPAKDTVWVVEWQAVSVCAGEWPGLAREAACVKSKDISGAVAVLPEFKSTDSERFKLTGIDQSCLRQ